MDFNVLSRVGPPLDEQTLFWITRCRIISGRRKVIKTQAKQANKQTNKITTTTTKNIKAIPQCGTQYSVTIIYFILFIFLTAERHHLLCERKERKRKRNLPQVLASDGMIFYNCWKTLSPLRMNKTTTTKTTTSPQILTSQRGNLRVISPVCLEMSNSQLAEDKCSGYSKLLLIFKINTHGS